VIIHAIEDSTFRAVLRLDQLDGQTVELDARPSDAIALAVRTGSPIWMLEEVVSDASIPVDAEADAQDQDRFRRFLDSVSPAELVRHLSRARPEPDQQEADGEADGEERGPGTHDDGDAPKQPGGGGAGG